MCLVTVVESKSWILFSPKKSKKTEFHFAANHCMFYVQKFVFLTKRSKFQIICKQKLLYFTFKKSSFNMVWKNASQKHWFLLIKMPQLRENLNQLLHSQLFLTENIDPKNYFDFVSLAVWFFVYQNMHKNVCFLRFERRIFI